MIVACKGLSRKGLNKEDSITLLVAQDLRRHIRLFIEQEVLRCTVLAFPELLAEVRVDIIGHIDLTADSSAETNTNEYAVIQDSTQNTSVSTTDDSPGEDDDPIDNEVTDTD